MGMMNLFKRMFSMDENRVPDTLTNQRVLDEMIELFSQQLHYRSVRKTMIFPMTFILYVHPSDYENLKESFPIFFPEVVDGFYEVIRKSREKHPVIGAHATEWNAYILPCLTENVVLDEKEVKVQKGELLIICSLFDVIEKKSEGSGPVKGLSLRINGSVYMNDINIDQEHFAGVEIMGEGHFRIPWKNPEKFSSSGSTTADDSLVSIVSNQVLAVLTCTLSGGTRFSYEMRDKVCRISGTNDKRNDASVFKIPSDIMGTPHVEIRYSDSTDRFEMAAYLPTKVDDILLPLSKLEDMHWCPLRNGAQICPTKKIFITFNRNKQQLNQTL